MFAGELSVQTILQSEFKRSVVLMLDGAPQVIENTHVTSTTLEWVIEQDRITREKKVHLASSPNSQKKSHPGPVTHARPLARLYRAVASSKFLPPFRSGEGSPQNRSKK